MNISRSGRPDSCAVKPWWLSKASACRAYIETTSCKFTPNAGFDTPTPALRAGASVATNAQGYSNSMRGHVYFWPCFLK